MITNQTNLFPELRNSLKDLAPNNSQLTQTITYALLATALVGIVVYHYIKNQELCSHQELCSQRSFDKLYQELLSHQEAPNKSC